MFRIRDIAIDNFAVLAPMAGVCDEAYLSIAKELGAGLVYSEMISEKGILYKNQQTLQMTRTNVALLSMQLFGHEVDSMKEAAIYLDRYTNCEIIDINMGCPVNKVVNAGSGSKLLLEPDKVYEIVKTIVEVVDKPVTAKIRIGFDSNTINGVEIAKQLERAGASAIAVHGRTRSQMYSGKVNLEEIKKIKDSVTIPVIGNGDIKDVYDAKKMIDYCNVDAIMIGRAALGNPWIFKDIDQYIKKGFLPRIISLEEKVEVCLEHCRRLVSLKGESAALKEMRTHACYYLKGVRNATDYRSSIIKINRYQELEELMKVVLLENKQ